MGQTERETTENNINNIAKYNNMRERDVIIAHSQSKKNNNKKGETRTKIEKGRKIIARLDVPRCGKTIGAGPKPVRRDPLSPTTISSIATGHARASPYWTCETFSSIKEKTQPNNLHVSPTRPHLKE